MAAKMTPRERLTTALRGEMPDQIPFTCYEHLLPTGTARETLHSLGVIALARVHPFKVRRKRVTEVTTHTGDDPYPTYITKLSTPLGTLQQKQIVEPGYGSLWTQEYLIKRPEDYAVFEFVLRDETYEADIDGFLEIEGSLGTNGMAVPRAADPPSQFLWRRFTGLERFALDWYDCRDEVMRVLDALRECNEEIWRIVANTPGEVCCSGGNMSGDMVGPSMFRELILPHFQREAEIMHPAGKRTFNHMDGILQPLVEPIAECPVDIIEAFNPVPDGDMSLAEARQAWPGKTISINFPSSVHLRTDNEIRETTKQLLRDSAPGDGFVVGITENMPDSVRATSPETIARTLNECGSCPLEL